MRVMPQTVVVSVLAWAAGASAAVVVGQVALSLIGEGLTTGTVQPFGGPLLAAAPAAAPEPSASANVDQGTPGPDPTPSARPSTPAPAATARPTPLSPEGRLVSSDGGTVIARCVDGNAYLVSWSPGQNYRVDDVRRGPGPEASVKFISGGHVVAVALQCVNGVPQARSNQGPIGRPAGPGGAPSGPTR
jgi:hypothetical protein